jgi:hypothetical protein
VASRVRQAGDVAHDRVCPRAGGQGGRRRLWLREGVYDRLVAAPFRAASRPAAWRPANPSLQRTPSWRDWYRWRVWVERAIPIGHHLQAPLNSESVRRRGKGRSVLTVAETSGDRLVHGASYARRCGVNASALPFLALPFACIIGGAVKTVRAAAAATRCALPTPKRSAASLSTFQNQRSLCGRSPVRSVSSAGDPAAVRRTGKVNRRRREEPERLSGPRWQRVFGHPRTTPNPSLQRTPQWCSQLLRVWVD